MARAWLLPAGSSRGGPRGRNGASQRSALPLSTLTPKAFPMRIPQATYRIQFTPDFGFRQAEAIIGYLADLGISDLYASPVFKARQGSEHGYDLVDPTRLNPELGSFADFESLSAKIRERSMGWLQDIVPNHMAFDAQNPYLADIFENGPSSRYYEFF